MIYDPVLFAPDSDGSINRLGTDFHVVPDNYTDKTTGRTMTLSWSVRHGPVFLRRVRDQFAGMRMIVRDLAPDPRRHK
jgi:hypothetical protein